MSDSEEERAKVGAPAWQLNNKNKEDASASRTTHEPPTTNATTIEQARRFLEEDEVKNASAERKMAFLKTKGLRRSDIQELLGASSHEQASDTTSAKPTLANSASTTQPQHLPPHSNQSTARSETPCDQPPIITYPEFLLQPAESKPLVTKHRLLTTLYLFGAVTVLMHGTNTYLLRPMFNSLTQSRLSLTSATLTKLRSLVQRLESSVSAIPITYALHPKSEVMDTDSVSHISDPTELFHRDIGIQTSFPSTPTVHTPTSPSLVSSNATNTTTQQASRLKHLQSRLASLMDDARDEESISQELDTEINLLKEYLQGLAYTAPSFGHGRNGSLKGTDISDDEISRVKKEIRGVKGVLLSAKSFPGGVGLR